MARGINRRNRHHHRSIVAGAIAGLVGGLVGTWAMSEVQALWSRRVDAAHDPDTASAGGRHDAREWQERVEGENANELAANANLDCRFVSRVARL